MLHIDRACIWIMMLGFALLIPSIDYIKFVDELCVAMLGALAMLDCIVNGNWRKYGLLWAIMGIMTFYAIYSITFVHYNTTKWVAIDWIIQLKPYVPIAVFLAVRPKLRQSDKQILRAIALFNAIVISLSFLGGLKLVLLLVSHPLYAGNVIFLSVMTYLYCSVDEEGKIAKLRMLTALCFLTIGLACTRSKYYGIYVLCLYFLFVYKPGMLRHLSAKHVLILVTVLLGVIVVSWSKFQFYFISGDVDGSVLTTGISLDNVNPKVMETFARPVLYITGFAIMMDYIPFGTGLASFATYASATNYSGVYHEYGINTVPGLSPYEPDFICDAFYPSLAQFGVVGFALFVYFWIYIYSFLRNMIRFNPIKYKYPFTIGSLLICFVLIESVAGTIFVQSVGMVTTCLLGLLICDTPRQSSHKKQPDYSLVKI